MRASRAWPLVVARTWLASVTDREQRGKAALPAARNGDAKAGMIEHRPQLRPWSSSTCDQGLDLD
jgi:hypothetical protein